MNCKKRIFFVLLVLSGSLCTFAQSLQLHLNNVTVQKAMTELKQKSGYSFVYEGSDLDIDRKVSVSATNLKQAVEQILKGQDVDYEIKDKNVIVFSKQQKDQTTGQPSQRQITGTINDNNGEPVVGATVRVKGTNAGVITDVDGRFTLDCPPDATLEVNYIGYEQQQINLRGRKNVTIAMQPSATDLNEVVVVGYGVQKKVNLTGSVASVDFTKEVSSRPVTTATQALAGMAAGIQILQGSGRPNGEGFGINIRGVGTLNNSSPLILVDGMEMSLSDVNANDIETISVLKDAASCAIYGNRGANGVILVTTKTGQADKIRITYSGKFSINKPAKLVRFISNYGDYMQFVNESYTNLGITNGPYSDATIQKWRDAEKDPNGISESGYPNYVAYPNTDWFDEIYKTKVMQEHSISVLGNERRTKYNIGLTYLDNPGMIVRSGVKKYFMNLNVVSDITDWLQVGAHAWGFHNDQQRNDVNNLSEWSFLKTVPGIYPYYDGHYGGIETAEEDGSAGNPLLNLNGNGDSYYKHNRIYATAHAQVRFLNDFTFKTIFGYDYFQERHKYCGTQNELYSFSRNQIVSPAASLDQIYDYMYYNQTYNWKWTNTLNWNHVFNKVHDVSVLLGFEEGKAYASNLDTSKYGILDTHITDMSTVTEMNYIHGADTQNRFRSYFGRLNYAYASRYLFEADFREDGSSRFAPGNRWGFFPSVSAGWRISEEAFAKNSFLNVFDNLKLRLSYGKLGNSSVDNYAYQSWYESGYTVMGGKKAPRFYLNHLPNIDVTWETTKTFDIGLDFSVLNSRLSGVIDYYNKYTSGILYSPSIGLTYGDKTSPLQNLAEVSNKGIELTLRWEDRAGDFTYGVAVNGSWNKNMVEKYKGTWIHGWGADPKNPDANVYYSNLGEVSSGGDTRIVEGHMMNEFYLYKTYSGNGSYFNQDGSVNINGGPKDGMIRTDKDMDWLNAMIAAGHDFFPNHSVGKDRIWYGDYIFADENNDGVYGGTNDRVFLGESNAPKFNFGMQAHMEWKGFDLSMNWGGSTGFKTYWREIGQNSSDVVYGLELPKDVAYDHYFYDPDNPADPRTNIGSKNPRLVVKNPSQSDGLSSTLRLYDCDFLKLRNLTIGYTLPLSITKAIYAQNIRVYFSGENLLTITSFPGLDPEMRSGEGYTTMRQFSFGVNVTF
ncbi:TonB-dependent receptor [Prevotella sp. kh1p2]|uniref:TonB-dependent receptor n=1 Tax=Prevotella sp. kh1p2 TaxID=1761883 RepID=UPI0008D7081D|nr:TonB-linked outer membrane protein, SusC/RagA family [Prevotella sp. kh1p2]SNU10392.1 TonB-linked outer membrane protein, SusC/RagA family [Prevotellaceae bacterium KH2P17]